METLLTPQQELFCQYYVKNDEMFGNATRAYAEAFGYDLDNMSNERPVEVLPDGTKKEEKSEYEKAYNICGVEGHKQLRKPKVNDRVVALLNEILTNEVVDSELAKVMKQDHKLDAKVNAIKEYNKLRGRIIEKRDVTSGGQPITVNLINYGDKPNNSAPPIPAPTIPVTVSQSLG